MISHSIERHLIISIGTFVIAMSQLVGCNNGYEIRHQARQDKAEQDQQIKAIYETKQVTVLSVSESASAAPHLNNQDIMRQGMQENIQQNMSRDALPDIQSNQDINLTARMTSQPKGRIVQEYAAIYRTD